MYVCIYIYMYVCMYVYTYIARNRAVAPVLLAALYIYVHTHTHRGTSSHELLELNQPRYSFSKVSELIYFLHKACT